MKEIPTILYYQTKSGVTYWIYESKGKHYLVEVRRIPHEEGLIKFLKESGGKALSSVIDVHDFTDHLNTAYKVRNHG